VICGLITASMMTMVLMPMLYRWFDDQASPDRSTHDEKEQVPRFNLLAWIRSRFSKKVQPTRI
jgi:cobalt-zinc-cadmium resistance protein CzcA